MQLIFKRSLVLVIIWFVSLQNVFSQNDVPTTEEIIERHLEAIGGREAINKIKTIEFAEMIYTPADTGFLESKIIIGKSIYSEDKKNSRFIIANDDMAVIKTKGQIMGAMFPVMMEAVGHEKTFEELNFLSSKYIIKYSGEGKVNDSIWAYQITISDFRGVVQTRAYDKKTGLLVLKLSKMGQLSYYSDYREVEGVLFPFKVNLGEDNETIVQYLKVNQEFDENIFEWNDKTHKKIVGKWMHKDKKTDKEDVFFFELNLREDRGGEQKTGYFDIKGDKIDSSRIPIIGWQLHKDTLIVKCVNYNELIVRYFKIKDVENNSFTIHEIGLEVDGVATEKSGLSNAIYYLKRE